MNQSPVFQQIEELRTELLADRSEIEVLDFGAGSRVNNSPKRQIRHIAKNAEKPRRFARLLYRLVQHFQPKYILDLGTSLGMTTAYLSAAEPSARVVSFEGCPETARIARQNFEQLHCHTIEVVVGNLDETLPRRVEQLPAIDFAFFDANHRYEPTVSYFETCLTKAHEDSVFVFDDIHWSDQMEQAWHYIQAHPKVTVTIDLFFVGLVFFRTKQPKQHFVLKYF